MDHSIEVSPNNSWASCAVACDAVSACLAIDFTTNDHSDACRLYGENEPRLGSGGRDGRQYCTKPRDLSQTSKAEQVKETNEDPASISSAGVDSKGSVIRKVELPLSTGAACLDGSPYAQ